MKKITGVIVLLLSINSLVFCSTNSTKEEKNVKKMKIKMIFEKEEIIVRMFDNKTTKDFLSKLPMTLEFEDYAKTEKISYLNSKLTVDKETSSKETSDFTYYAPWGNLAVFYKGYGNDGGLVKMGIIESGKDKLIKIKDGSEVKIEVLE